MDETGDSSEAAFPGASGEEGMHTREMITVTSSSFPPMYLEPSQDSGCRVQGAGCRVQGAGLRDQCARVGNAYSLPGTHHPPLLVVERIRHK